MSKNKHTPFAHVCFDKIEEEWFLTGQGKGTKPLYSAETVEQLEAENAALRKQRDDLLALLKTAEVLFACRCNDATSANWLDNARDAISSVKGHAG